MSSDLSMITSKAFIVMRAADQKVSLKYENHWDILSTIRSEGQGPPKVTKSLAATFCVSNGLDI